MSVPKPLIIQVPYTDESAVIESTIASVFAGSHVEQTSLQLLMTYPVVYIVNSENDDFQQSYTVYVGETNNIVTRTRQHLRHDITRNDWNELAQRALNNPEQVTQYIIGNAYFNKSLTLDIENKLMSYLMSSDSVKQINNRRTNAQGNYYTQHELDQIFDEIWLGLHKQNPELFPSEKIILDSALFKASPFHELSADQKEAEENILSMIAEVFRNHSTLPQLILVSGAAGTGKTVLLSHLFNRICVDFLAEQNGENIEYDDNSEEYIDHDDEDIIADESQEVQRKAFILVNHSEQLNVYNQIATKLGLQKKDDEIVKKPSTFIKDFSKKYTEDQPGLEKPKTVYEPQGRADIVLIDEAHLLSTQGNQGYSGTNMLADILQRAKVVIAVFDPMQILQSRQRWMDKNDQLLLMPPKEHESNDLAVCFHGVQCDLHKIRLHQQFRMDASEDVLAWFNKFIHEGCIGPIPVEYKEKKDEKDSKEPYDIHVFDSPIELMKAIQEKAQQKARGVDGKGLSRVIASYDWVYKDKKDNPDSTDGMWNVELFKNSDGWAMKPDETWQGTRGYKEDNQQSTYFCQPWNYELKRLMKKSHQKNIANSNLAWAEEPHTINEIGSTYTIQGFDLNYAGVILGPSVKYDPQTKRIYFDSKLSKNSKAVNKRDSKYDFAQENLRNELNVLLTRGVHGLYIFAVDPELQQVLKQRQEEHDAKMKLNHKEGLLHE